jgi:hypothetical protein
VRVARNIAALVALATVGFAVGDFASHPNAPGAVGILLLIVIFALLIAYLFRPQGDRVKPPPKPEPERRLKPKAPEPVWSGWDASEARSARERRHERPRD